MDPAGPGVLPLKSVEVHDGRSTDVRVWPASQRVSDLVVFICGNPGLIDYYDEFLSRIHRSLPRSFEVIGYGHEGHSYEHPLSFAEALSLPTLLRTRALPSLQDQIDRKVAYVKKLSVKYGSGTRVHLIGHSVGAYICLQILRCLPEDVYRVYGLFPTIADIAATPNGRRLSPLLTKRVLPGLALLTGILGTLTPRTVLHWLVRTATGQSAPASIVTTGLVSSPACVSAAVAMAADEMREIRELDKSLLETLGHKITLYFAAGSDDHWVGGPEEVADITAVLDSRKGVDDPRERWHVCKEGMVHAFCLEHSSAMADLCAAWLARDIDSAPAKP